MLKGRTVLLGAIGGIACCKSAGPASALVRQGVNVQILMARNATEFIDSHILRPLAGNRVSMGTFDRNYQFQVEYIVPTDQADLVLVTPATVNILTELAHGLADDMLTTTVLACGCPKTVASAMNTRMYENLATQDNLIPLRWYGWGIMEPASGCLACGAVGKEKIPEPKELLETVFHALSHAKGVEGPKVLVAAGPTQEALDLVRYLTNHSTGWMGYTVARVAAACGAEVTLMSGPTALKKSAYVEAMDVVSAQDMFEAVTTCAPERDIIIKAAAAAGYRPAQVAQDKTKRGERELSIPLEHTWDILAWLGEYRWPGQFPCGFSVETRDMVGNSRGKLGEKHLDLIAANSLKEPGADFAVPTNLLTLVSPQEKLELPLLIKEEAVHRLLNEILKLC